MANPTTRVPMATVPWGDDKILRPLSAAVTTFYPGEMIAIDASGNAVHCDNTAGIRFDGINALTARIAENTGEAAGDRSIMVERPWRFTMKIAAAVAGDEGKALYAAFSDEVSYSQTNSIFVGWVDQVLTATLVLVRPAWSGQAVGGANSFDGNTLTFNGSTSSNVIVIPDNLASALAVKEGSNKYLEFISTDSSEAVKLYKTLTLPTATGTAIFAMADNLADALSIQESTNKYITFVTTDSSEAINVLKTLAFAGTTANNIISMVDNLADALNVKQGSNSYLKFITTDGSEAIVAGKVIVQDTAALTATGTVQGNAAAIIHAVSFSTGDDTVGVLLPVTIAGDTRYVYNLAATAGLKVYPGTSCTINQGSANAAVTIEGKTLAMFIATNTTNWAAIYTANS